MNQPQRKGGQRVPRLIEMQGTQPAQPVEDDPALIPVEEAARRIGITPGLAFKWIRRGKLFAITDQKPYLVPAGEVERFRRMGHGEWDDTPVRG